MASVATFCLLHGAWHDPYCWQPLAAQLRARGHDAVAPDLPFHDRRTGYQERVGPALEALQGAADPVMVVSHSMASTYAPLVATARERSLLVHVCPRLGPFAAPPGAPKMFRAGVPFPDERPDGTTIWDAQTAIEVLYRRLPAATARGLARRLRPLAPAAGAYPLSAHPDVPTAVIYTADDEIFEPAWERFMATELLRIQPVELPGGHFPMLERTEAVADILDRLAARGCT